MAVIDHIFPDSPTNTFATWNALNYKGNSLLDGNLNHYITTTASNYAEEALATIAFDSANSSIYFEVYIKNGDTSGGSGARSGIGVVPSNAAAGTYGNAFSLIGSYVFFGGNSQFYSGTYSTPTANVWYSSGTSYGSSLAIGNIVGVFINNGSLYYSINGSWVNSSDGTFGNVTAAAKTGITGYKVPAVLTYLNGNNDGQLYLNTGQDHTFGGYPNSLASSSGYPDANGIGSFYYDPPTGALALCTANLPSAPDLPIDPALDDLPEDYFKAVKYVGNGAATSTGVSNTISMGMPADLIWIKSTDGTSGHHIVDTVRGIGTGRYKSLRSDSTNQELTSESYSGVTGGVTDIDQTNNEFTVHARTGWVGDDVNRPSYNFVAWCFRAGGAPSATDDGTGVSGSAKLVDTSGTASSTTCKSFKDAAVTAGASNVICPSKMSINQKAGFSIVKYTSPNNTSNQTVPHGLSQPDLIFVKNLNTTFNWDIYHSGVTNSGIFTDAAINSRNSFGTVDGNIFTTINNYTHSGTDNYIAYCWHSVAGYSAFGSYTGNGVADGPFIYTGFRPAWIMVKWIFGGGLTTGSWRIMDTARNPYNPATLDLIANEAVTETTYGADDLDILSNGFKWRSTGSFHNTNGAQYIYAAWAEQPGKYSNAR